MRNENTREKELTMEIGSNPINKHTRTVKSHEEIKHVTFRGGKTGLYGSYYLYPLTDGLGVDENHRGYDENNIPKGYEIDEAAATKYYDTTIDFCVVGNALWERIMRYGLAADVQRPIDPNKVKEMSNVIVNDAKRKGMTKQNKTVGYKNPCISRERK